MAIYTASDYVIGFAILIVIYKLLKDHLFTKIRLDVYFLISIIPPIIFALTIRLLADANVYTRNELWNATPGVYVLGTIYGAVLIGTGYLVQKRKGIEYWKTVLVIGAVTIPYFFIKLVQVMQNPLNFFYPVVLAVVLTAPVYLILKNFGPTSFITKKENLLIVFAHMLDASGTFIGMERFGFSEENPIPEFLIGLAGTAAVMIPLKLLIVIPALYLIEKWESESPQSDLDSKMLKVIIFVMGFGPGMRNSLLQTLWDVQS